MESILIKDTTKEQREQIVAESIGNISGACDGCMSGLADIYQDYIDGKKEIREINMEFRAHYESGVDGPEKTDCGYKRLIYRFLEQKSATILRRQSGSLKSVA